MATTRRQVHYSHRGRGNRKARKDARLVRRTIAAGFARIEAGIMDRKYIGSDGMVARADGAVALFERVGFLAPNSTDAIRSMVTFQL